MEDFFHLPRGIARLNISKRLDRQSVTTIRNGVRHVLEGEQKSLRYITNISEIIRTHSPAR